MNPKLKKIVILVIVMSVILTIGGVVYTSLLGVENSQYTKTMATIVEIETEQAGDNAFIVKGAVVSYETPEGMVTSSLKGVLPNRLEIGAQVEVRFKNDDVAQVTTEMIDWFPAVMLLILGVLYAVCGAMIIVFKKKAGYYAIVEQTNDPAPLEDDEFSIADQIEKMDEANEIVQIEGATETQTTEEETSQD